MNKAYNWWDDPKNAEEVKRISWWEHDENKTTIQLPVSIIKRDDCDRYTIAANKDTKELIGDIGGASSAYSKDEVAISFWNTIKFHQKFLTEQRLNYQRWVPFRKGPWGKIGGNWFAIFGFHVYFRYENKIKLKGGWYFPFTKLNISFSNDWIIYTNWKKENYEKVSNNIKSS